eukprot:s758_g3.t1
MESDEGLQWKARMTSRKLHSSVLRQNSLYFFVCVGCESCFAAFPLHPSSKTCSARTNDFADLVLASTVPPKPEVAQKFLLREQERRNFDPGGTICCKKSATVVYLLRVMALGHTRIKRQ